jgi:hypothetical protein
MSPFARRQSAINNGPNSYSNQTLNWVTDCVTHATNLTISSFMNHDSQNTILQLTHLCGRSNAIVQLDTIS